MSSHSWISFQLCEGTSTWRTKVRGESDLKAAVAIWTIILYIAWWIIAMHNRKGD